MTLENDFDFEGKKKVDLDEGREPRENERSQRDQKNEDVLAAILLERILRKKKLRTQKQNNDLLD